MKTAPLFCLETASLEGTTLIEASAGTGKTYTLTALVLRFLLEKELPIEQILIVTFTRAATEELRGRIHQAIRDTVELFEEKSTPDDPFKEMLVRKFCTPRHLRLLRKALASFDLARISTIHGFCERLLRQHGFECGVSFETNVCEDLSDLTRSVCLDFWREHIQPFPGNTGLELQKNLTPDMLLKLASIPVLHQKLRLEPQGELPLLEPYEARVETLSAQLKTLWIAESQNICALLEKHRPGFHKRNFSENTCNMAIQGLQTWSTTKNSLPQDLPKESWKLTATALCKNTTKQGTPPEHPFFALLDALQAGCDALYKLQNRTIDLMKAFFLQDFPGRLAQRKTALQVQGFDDLLSLTHKAIHNPLLQQAVATQIRAALIDEFQDTDALQYAVFQTLFTQKGQSLFFIGDPKQAIYAFRGADIHTYLHAAQNCQRVATLGANYRSTADCVHAVNQLFGQQKEPFRVPGISFYPVSCGRPDLPPLTDDKHEKAAIVLWHLPSEGKALSKSVAEELLLQGICAETHRLLRGGQTGKICIGDETLKPQDIAILVQTNAQGEAVRSRLENAGIHAVLQRTQSLFESQEAADMLAVMNGLFFYTRTEALHTALATSFFAQKASALRALKDNPEKEEFWLESFGRGHSLWKKSGILAALKNLFQEHGVQPKLLSQKRGERRITNTLHCLEVLHHQEKEQNFTMSALLTWFSRRLCTENSKEHLLRLESDAEAVHILTLHKSKGLQYPVVFCPFPYKKPEHGEWTLTSEDNELVLDLNPKDNPDRQQNALQNIEAEQMRLLYVALTRASCRTYLAWGRINKTETTPLSWLLHGKHWQNQTEIQWKFLSEKQLQEDLAHLEHVSLGTLCIASLPEDAEPAPLQDQPSLLPLHIRPWDRQLKTPYGITSFSALTRASTHGTNPPESEEHVLPEKNTENGFQDFTSLHNFPRGARAGSCLHYILEQCLQGEDHNQALERGLSLYGFSLEWCPAVQNMINAVFTVDIGGFSLQNVTRIRTEMEFLLPINRITAHELQKLYKFSQKFLASDIPTQIEHLRFEPRKGFLTGFMDAVFSYKGKYFLLDWKSNWLGPESSWYGADALQSSVIENWYFLQYHLYCLALDRLLYLRLPEYSYSEHFGGVLYPYLRGIDSCMPGHSIYKDIPDPTFMQALRTLFLPHQEDF